MSPGLTHHLNISVENHVAFWMLLPCVGLGLAESFPELGRWVSPTGGGRVKATACLSLDKKSTCVDPWQEKSNQKAAGFMAPLLPTHV